MKPSGPYVPISRVPLRRRLHRGMMEHGVEAGVEALLEKKDRLQRQHHQHGGRDADRQTDPAGGMQEALHRYTDLTDED